ncbi:hypothetical protein GCM10009765_44250 [Fodinicola feengrottensis]|uniref:DSBA-like thioredoxin domain-containing protein n=1 Tax=Fodinicola feengrottensis TaxID=435914 RepID=A0ABN2HLR9_9ACTN
MTGRIWFDHRAFPLELFNQAVNSRPGVDSEVAVVGALAPEAGWRLWREPDWTYPVTMLPALEAVQAAKAQGWQASALLDRSLRRAFWAEHRCISLQSVILEVAAETGGIDVSHLEAALVSGVFRSEVIEQFRTAQNREAVKCSPHVFLADGTSEPNPGVRARWVNGEFGIGFPVIEADDPTVITKLVRRTAELAGL